MIEAIRIVEPGTIDTGTRDPISIAAGEARIKMEAVGICGSDVAMMNGTHPYAIYPVIPGHELAGRVLEAPNDGQVHEGQLVAVRPTLTCGTCSACLEGRTNNCKEVRVLGVHLDGGMAGEMAVPCELLYACPETMTADQAVLVEPTAVATHARRRAGLGSGMSLAVIGSGVIGLLILQIAKSRGCTPILAIDQIPERLELAVNLGADQALNNVEVDAATSGRELCPDGFDVVMDMVGVNATLADSIRLARRGGTIIPVALPHGSIEFDFEPLYRKELSIISSRLYNGDFFEAIELIASGVIDAEAIITHHFPLRDAATAFSTLMDHPEEAIKVVITP